MIKKITAAGSMFLLLMIFSAAAVDIKTPEEMSNFESTARYGEIIDFLYKLSENSNNIRIETLCRSTEGRDVPLVIIGDPLPSSPAEARRNNRTIIYIQANIHAGEVAGKAAILMLMRDILLGEYQDIARQAILLIVPDYNSDGNEKISPQNRSYVPNPASGVGVRYNGQGLDINRDYIKLETPEAKATIEKIYRMWDPLLTMDLHDTNGSYHKYVMTYLTGKEPQISKIISDYTWDKLLPAVTKVMKEKDGVDSLPYGNFEDEMNPEKGWESFPDSPRLCSSYVSYRNRFAILSEAYAHAPFKDKIKASYSLVLRSIQFTLKNADEMKKIVNNADRDVINQATLPYENRGVMPLKVEAQQNGTITVHSFKFEPRKEKGVYPRYRPLYDQPMVYKVPLMNNWKVIEARTYSSGYILPESASDAARHLKLHGIIVERILKPAKAKYQRFYFAQIKPSERSNQGHWITDVTGEWKDEEGMLPAGSFYVGMNQPLGRLIAVMLEPDSGDSLLNWNFFDRFLAAQWGNRIYPYPVIRINEPLKIAKWKVD